MTSAFDVLVQLSPTVATLLDNAVLASNPETAAILSPSPSTQSETQQPIYPECRINVYDSADPRGAFAHERGKPRSLFDPRGFGWSPFDRF